VTVTITKRYPLEPHGRKRLALRRDLATGDVAVVLDGRELGRIPREALHEGVDFALPDESLLHVWNEVGPNGTPYTCVTRNGHPLPGSASDPVKILWVNVVCFWGLATLQLFFAAMTMAYGEPDGSVYAIGAAGLALALLAAFAWYRSYVATVLASIIVIVEAALFSFFEGRHDVGSLVSASIALGILIYLMLRGINAVAEIKSHTLPIRRPPERIPQ